MVRVCVRGSVTAMQPLSAAEAEYLPISSDSDIEGRVGSLIGRARGRSLWMLFLTTEDIQLPLMIPLADYPSCPGPESAAQLGFALRQSVDVAGAAKVVLVWERCQGRNLTATDKAWARAAVEACRHARVPLRAQLVSHREGIRWLAPDDCL